MMNTEFGAYKYNVANNAGNKRVYTVYVLSYWDLDTTLVINYL